jgi:hypothetical protein
LTTYNDLKSDGIPGIFDRFLINEKVK